jgi:hypothetical protein
MHIRLYYLLPELISFFPSNLDDFLLFLAWLLLLELLAICFIIVVKLSIFVLFLMGEAFSFPQLDFMSIVGFTYVTFISFKKFPSVSTLLSHFIMKRCWIWSTIFSAWIEMWVFSPLMSYTILIHSKFPIFKKY